MKTAWLVTETGPKFKGECAFSVEAPAVEYAAFTLGRRTSAERVIVKVEEVPVTSIQHLKINEKFDWAAKDLVR